MEAHHGTPGARQWQSGSARWLTGTEHQSLLARVSVRCPAGRLQVCALASPLRLGAGLWVALFLADGGGCPIRAILPSFIGFLIVHGLSCVNGQRLPQCTWTGSCSPDLYRALVWPKFSPTSPLFFPSPVCDSGASRLTFFRALDGPSFSPVSPCFFLRRCATVGPVVE